MGLQWKIEMKKKEITSIRKRKIKLSLQLIEERPASSMQIYFLTH